MGALIPGGWITHTNAAGWWLGYDGPREHAHRAPTAG